MVESPTVADFRARLLRRGAARVETARFALIVALTGAVALAAVLINRLSARLRLPAPVLMLAAAAIAVFVIPGVPEPRDEMVQQVVSVALVLILFNGGRHIGWSRLRPALGLIIIVGLLGHLPHRGRWRRLAARGFRAGLVRRPAGGDRGFADRSGGGVLGPRAARNRWAQRRNPGGRIRGERPRRDRIDGRGCSQPAA